MKVPSLAFFPLFCFPVFAQINQFSVSGGKTKLGNKKLLRPAISFSVDYKRIWQKRNSSFISGFQYTDAGISAQGQQKDSKKLLGIYYMELYAGLGKQFSLFGIRDRLVLGITVHGRHANEDYAYPPPYLPDLIYVEKYTDIGAGGYISYFVPVIKNWGIEANCKSRAFTNGIKPITTYSIGLSFYISDKQKNNIKSSSKL